MTLRVKHRLFLGVIIGFSISSMLFGLLINDRFILKDDLRDRKRVLIDRQFYIMCPYNGQREFACK